jgi:hypothetical protein
MKLPIINPCQYGYNEYNEYTLYLFSTKGNINILETKDDPFKVREPEITWEFKEGSEIDLDNILFLILEEDTGWILPETLNPIKHRAIIRQHQAISYDRELDIASLKSRAFLIESQNLETINSVLSKNKKNPLTKKIKYAINNTIKHYLDYVLEKNQMSI